MCDECRCTPCAARCPNVPEPPIVAVCEDCKDDIYDGEECFTDGEGYLCKSCVDSMSMENALVFVPNVSVQELLEMDGWELKTAEAEGFGD